MSTPGGYEATECMHIEETTYRKTPTSGAWNHVANVMSLLPRSLVTRKEKARIGTRTPTAYQKRVDRLLYL